MAGRPTKITDEVKDKICEDLANGAYLKDICDEIGVDRSNVYRATKADQEFGVNYDRAYTFSVDAQLDDATALLQEAVSRDQILKADKLVNAAQWKAEKRSKQYQPVQKQEVAHSGPSIISWAEADPTPERVIPDAVLDDIVGDEIAN